jgi:hypothetical protein
LFAIVAPLSNALLSFLKVCFPQNMHSAISVDVSSVCSFNKGTCDVSGLWSEPADSTLKKPQSLVPLVPPKSHLQFGWETRHGSLLHVYFQSQMSSDFLQDLICTCKGKAVCSSGCVCCDICPFPLPHFASIFFNIFCLFVILSLTQLYRYTPEIFLFSTATFKYTYRAPSDVLDKNIQRWYLLCSLDGKQDMDHSFLSTFKVKCHLTFYKILFALVKVKQSVQVVVCVVSKGCLAPIFVCAKQVK